MITLCKYSKADHAIAKPSNVAVPLPISSRITKDLSVEVFKISEVSIISIIKVDCPLARSSAAPTREKILSTSPIFAFLAGTNKPA